MYSTLSTDPKNRQSHSGFRQGHYPSSVADVQHPHSSPILSSTPDPPSPSRVSFPSSPAGVETSSLIEGYVPPAPLSSSNHSKLPSTPVLSSRSSLLEPSSPSAVIPSAVTYHPPSQGSHHPVYIPCMHIYEHIASCHVCNQIYGTQRSSTFSFVAHLFTILSVGLLLLLLGLFYHFTRTFPKHTTSPSSLSTILSQWWSAVEEKWKRKASSTDPPTSSPPVIYLPPQQHPPPLVTEGNE